ncbi:MAG: molecular chaperone HtpG, partial [Clostridia bacterium]|nr:molecular chaperone HtpG [Clostridia bacterium]
FIDTHFLSFLEYNSPDKVKFMRIDAGLDSALKEDGSEDDTVLADIFKNTLNNDKLTIKFEKLKNAQVPAVIITDEYMRRYSEMGQFYGMTDGVLAHTLIVNKNSRVISKIKELDEEKQKFVVNYVYSLALLSFKKLEAEELDNFVNANITLLDNYIK